MLPEIRDERNVAKVVEVGTRVLLRSLAMRSPVQRGEEIDEFEHYLPQGGFLAVPFTSVPAGGIYIYLYMLWTFIARPRRSPRGIQITRTSPSWFAPSRCKPPVRFHAGDCETPYPNLRRYFLPAVLLDCDIDDSPLLPVLRLFPDDEM